MTVTKIIGDAIPIAIFLALLGLTIALGAYNVATWLTSGMAMLAVIAFFSEAIGFGMAVMVEMTARGRQPLKACVALTILVSCAAFNVLGGERAWRVSQETQAEAAWRQAQTRLDRERAELQTQIANAQAAIARQAHLLPTADTMRARQAGMMEAWRIATVQDREQVQRLQRLLDSTPVLAERQQAEHNNPMVIAIFGLAELAKALGLWACGFSAPALRRRKEPVETGPLTETRTSVIAFPQETIKKRARHLVLVEGLSYAEAGRRLGKGRGTVYKWCN